MRRRRGARFGTVILCRNSLLVPVGVALELLTSHACRAGAALYVQIMGQPTGHGTLSCRFDPGTPRRVQVLIAQRLAREIAAARRQLSAHHHPGVSPKQWAKLERATATPTICTCAWSLSCPVHATPVGP